MLHITQGNRNDRAYKSMMNDLMQTVFHFSFEPWYALNQWDDRYECHSIIENGLMLSNVSVAIMDLLIGGKNISAIQLGAVATRPECRGQGYSKQLIGHILDKYEGMPAFLFADEAAFGFYTRFGFEHLSEVQPYIHFATPFAGGGFAKLSMDSPELARLLKNRHRFSQVVDAANAEWINWFHIVMAFQDSLYYLPQYDTLIIAAQKGDIVTVYDVMGDSCVPFEELLRLLPFGSAGRVEFAFTPDWLGVDYLTADNDSSLFGKGIDFGPDSRFPCMAAT